MNEEIERIFFKYELATLGQYEATIEYEPNMLLSTSLELKQYV